MNKDTVLSFVRTLLTGFSAYFIGKHILGSTIDAASWQNWVALIVGLASTAWGIFDKTTTMEGIQSFLRSAVIFIGGLFVAKGSISQAQLDSLSGLLLVIVPFIYSWINRTKTANIVAGKFVINPTTKKLEKPKPAA